jgi:dTDP-4-dehydrorhamnose reductase
VAHIATLDWPTPTVRPRYSVLSLNHWLSFGNAPLRPWAEAVDDYVANYLAGATPADSVSAGDPSAA